MQSDEATVIRRLLGLSLKDTEAKTLVARFTDKSTGKFDEESFVKNLKGQIEDLTSSRLAREMDIHRPDTIEKTKHDEMTYYEKILSYIRKGILNKVKSMPKEDFLQNSFKLLSENRSPYLTPAQFKSACLYRLNVALTDHQVALVFQRLDPEGKGTLYTKDLIKLILKEAYGNYQVSIDIQPSPPSSPTKIHEIIQNKSWVLNQAAHVSYDHKFTGLIPPEPNTALYLPNLQLLERKIYDKVFEVTQQGGNMYQLLIRLFSDGRDKLQRQHGITRDQIRYTLWKSLQLRASDDAIDLLFQRYDPARNGYITMQVFCDAIMNAGHRNDPLLEDLAVSSEAKMKNKRKDVTDNDDDDGDSKGGTGRRQIQLDPPQLNAFLQYMRRKFRDKINREGRAPHYLINVAERMTKSKAREYLKEKFDAEVSDGLLDELNKIYNSKGLFNMKLLLHDAMALKDGGKLGPDPNLLAGGTVSADERPSSLRGIAMTPQQIESIFANKIMERLKLDQPMSTVHKIFKLSDTDGDVRFVNRAIMRNVLSKFDILPSDHDFEKFFQKHLRRADGTIEVRQFIQELLTAGNPTLNPYLPKDEAEFAAQVNLAKALSSMTGHLRRQISSLNGPAHTRLTVDGDEGDGSAAEEAKDLLELANTKTTRAMQIHGYAAATKVGIPISFETTQRTQVVSQPPSSRPPLPHRPESAPPSLQTMQHDSNRSPRAKGHSLHLLNKMMDNNDVGDDDIMEGDSEGQEVGGEEGYEFDDLSQRARVEWDLDNRGREEEEEWSFGSARSTHGTMASGDWEQYQQQHHHHQQQHRPQSQHISNRQQQLQQQQQPVTKKGVTFPSGPRPGPYPHAPPANEVLASRRVPHVRAWKKTDPYQELLRKKYAISNKHFRTSKDEYGLFGKDLNRLIEKEKKLKQKYEQQRYSRK